MVRVHCVVFGCSNTQGDQVAVHKFPSDPYYSKLWINFVKRTRKWEALQKNRFRGICSVHFEDSCYMNKLQVSMGLAKCLHLKPGAVPTRYPGHTSQADAACSVSSQLTPEARKRELQLEPRTNKEQKGQKRKLGAQGEQAGNYSEVDGMHLQEQQAGEIVWAEPLPPWEPDKEEEMHIKQEPTADHFTTGVPTSEFPTENYSMQEEREFDPLSELNGMGECESIDVKEEPIDEQITASSSSSTLSDSNSMASMLA